MSLAQIPRLIATEIGANPAQVTAAVDLLDGGATVPFIARYRKEVTGGLDEDQLRKLADIAIEDMPIEEVMGQLFQRKPAAEAGPREIGGPVIGDVAPAPVSPPGLDVTV